MKKQFTAFLALLTLTTLFTGCGQNKEASKTPEVIVSEEETTTDEEMPPVTVGTEDADVTEEADTDETSEANSANETGNADQEAKDEEASKEEKPSKEDSKNESAQETPSKPTVSEKPNNEQKPSAPVKPSTPANPSKPAQSQKPNESQKPVPPANAEKPDATEKPAETPEASTLSSSAVLSQITSGMDFSNHMELDDDFLRDFYSIDPSLLEDYCVQMPMLSFQITEIGVFKVKDASQVNTVVAGINSRINNLGTSLYPSLEETYNARVIKTKGNYILFAIADNASDIQTRFNSLVK